MTDATALTAQRVEVVFVPYVAVSGPQNLAFGSPLIACGSVTNGATEDAISYMGSGQIRVFTFDGTGKVRGGILVDTTGVHSAVLPTSYVGDEGGAVRVDLTHNGGATSGAWRLGVHE